MAKMAGIVYTTAGIAGMSAVVYDAFSKAKRYSTVGSEEAQTDVFESSFAAKRTSTDESKVISAMQNKISDLRMKNPLVPLFGKTTGFISGFFSGLGDNIIPVTLSAIAMATKGTVQKTGAWGLGIYAVYKVLKEGFGVGKTTAIDK